MSAVPVTGCSGTDTEVTQHGTEQDLLDFYSRRLTPELQRRNHASYLKRNVLAFPTGSQGLHCSQPWLVYWTLQAADVLGILDELYAIAPPKALAARIMGFYVVEGIRPFGFTQDACGAEVGRRLERYGGFSGGPGQLPHLAASYAAVMSLAIISERYPEVLTLLSVETSARDDGVVTETSIIRELSNWMSTLFVPASKDSSNSNNIDNPFATSLVACLMAGSFSMHTGGESDIRASYTVATISSLLRFPREWTSPYINATSIGFIRRCYTYEGGVACSPLSPEAHGGYASLGLAALMLWDAEEVEAPSTCNFDTLSARLTPPSAPYHDLGRWLSARQCSWEGGFNGRTNKLVDSCYSFWVGAAVALYEGIRSKIALKDAVGESDSQRSEGEAIAAGCSPSVYNVMDELRLENFALPGLLSMQASMNEEGEDGDADSSNRQNQRAGFISKLEKGAERAVEEMVVTDAFICAAFEKPQSDSESGGDDDNDNTAQRERMVGEPQRDENVFGAAHAEDPADLEDAAVFQPSNTDPWGFYTLANQRRLQQYVFKFCQNSQRGGLMDKPYCPNDAYHTCYSLSGATCMQEGFLREKQCSHNTGVAARNEGHRLSQDDVVGLLDGWGEAGAGWGTFLARTDWETEALERARPTHKQQKQHSSVGEGMDDEVGTASPYAPTATDVGILSATNPIYNVRPRHVSRVRNALGE